MEGEHRCEVARSPAQIVDAEEYNFLHFRTRHILNDVVGTVQARGVPPGEIAPDWELPDTGGHSLRLSELRSAPVLLHLGSPT
jgi:hypothetical protein